MSHENRDQRRGEGSSYRLEVQGRIPSDRKEWFGADTMTPVGAHTVILLRVVDQSDLYGRLRKIHDLNLTLVAVQRIEEADPSPGPGRDESP